MVEPRQPYLIKSQDDKEDLTVLLRSSGFSINGDETIYRYGSYQGQFQNTRLNTVQDSELDKFLIVYKSQEDGINSKQSKGSEGSEAFHRLFSK